MCSCYLISFTSRATPGFLPDGKSRVIELQERCFEIELTNEVDGINDDDLLVVKQMDMDMKNETLPRIFIVSQECY